MIIYSVSAWSVLFDELNTEISEFGETGLSSIMWMGSIQSVKAPAEQRDKSPQARANSP